MASNNGGNSERDLLDRLNALKPGSGTQDFAPKPIVTRTLPLADPRQDVLSDRLRALRNQSSDGSSSSAVLKTSGSTAESQVGKHTSSLTAGSPLPLGSAPVAAGTEPGEDEEEEDDDGFMSDLGDDGTLEDYLEDLELDLEEGNDEVSNQQPPSKPADGEVNAEDDAKRIAAVLARIGKGGSALPPSPSPGAHQAPRRLDVQGGSAGDDSEDDKRNQAEAENIVSQAFDEAKFDREISTPLGENSEEQRPLSSQRSLSTSHEQDARRPDDRQASPLDDAPTAAKESLSLPAVPNSLPGPAPTTTTTATPVTTGDDFESDISRRLAALRGLGGSGSGGDGDLALPSVPSFQPAANNNNNESRVKSTGGYTDEDEEGWCLICLEDATSICDGCDGDVYCDGCWWDMHLGPEAAFDGSHKRWFFIKERRRRRALPAA
ncbi:hypothetical protein PoMZ_11382 [Pyricularia oryzae]|uniref:Zinc finger FYVE domain-containing protein n=1 Tax=Pyricularia oryzae TaxID=318829 RepID=A0A4P7NK76_PYROR|nr:hypothetical protein PoMZ_11382 [Pyricularia oryzae]